LSLTNASEFDEVGIHDNNFQPARGFSVFNMPEIVSFVFENHNLFCNDADTIITPWPKL